MTLQSKFSNYITTKTLNIALYKWDRITKQKDGQTWWTFQAGGIKTAILE